MKHNFILLSDSYKVSHYKQYPPKTTKVYSYYESRGGKFPNTVFYGLQYILKEYLTGQVVTPNAIAEAEGLLAEHFSSRNVFNRQGWQHIMTDHGGKLPLSIRAVAEGRVVPVSNALMTVENTCPQCYWLTNYVETLLVQVWYPIAVATQSRVIKKIIAHYLDLTGDPAGIDFKLHDFGFRGASSVETAALGGSAHLVNFRGTDTMAALKLARDYYDCRPVAGFSIPAAEHSTITSWGREHEVKAFENMLDQYPTGLVAVVSDSFDIYNACQNLWGGVLRDKVLARDGLLVVRPDSGNPVEVVKTVIELLADKFGHSTNAKGFKVLHDKVRVIQGDGVNQESITAILSTLMFDKWSADNIAFGMGGALLQKLDRDTQKSAFKCSYVEGEDFAREVYKQPATDPSKNSKRGRLALMRNQITGEYATIAESDDPLDRNLLKEVYRNGELLLDTSFDVVRSLAE